MRLIAFLAALSIGALSHATPFPSTYQADEHPATVITNVVVLTGSGERFDNASVLFANGKIRGINTDIIPDDAVVIDGAGRWVTPGIIDVHSHLGVYPSPSVDAHSDGNEMTAPVTAEVWAEHSIWPQDPGFSRALAGGITTLQILPGSANLFGGRSVTLKNVPSVTYQGMKFPEAPYGLKMACGENSKRVYGRKGRAPSTRMGNVAAYRTAWIKAEKYRDDMARYNALSDEEKLEEKPPQRDLELETLAGVLNGDILIHMHCYRADEMMTILDLAAEFDYNVGTFHHGVEAGIPIIVDGLSNLPSSFDSIGARLDNAALSHKAGVPVLFSSGETHNARKIRQGAGTAVAHGLPYDDALRALTTLPSELLDGPDRSVRVGSTANLTVWSGDPLEVTSYATSVIIDGKEIPMVSRQQLLLERYLPQDQGQGRAYIKP